ncbi:MAG: hypothetical protein D4R73_00905 [Deltaproteobacteria bacterium]|nr:MAG: hypothetical protein D4R73_00905 [Deltaproteobacteria bacterium]
MEICAIIPSTRGFGFKNRNFGEFSPGKEVQKTIFGQLQPSYRIISDNNASLYPESINPRRSFIITLMAKTAVP